MREGTVRKCSWNHKHIPNGCLIQLLRRRPSRATCLALVACPLWTARRKTCKTNRGLPHGAENDGCALLGRNLCALIDRDAPRNILNAWLGLRRCTPQFVSLSIAPQQSRPRATTPLTWQQFRHRLKVFGLHVASVQLHDENYLAQATQLA